MAVFYFRIHDSGAAQFYSHYRFGGEGKWFALGHYADKSLSDARDAAREWRVLAWKGVDPALGKQRATAELWRRSFADVAKDWYARQIKPKYKNPEVVERVLHR